MAESVGMDYRTYRKYVRDHPDANGFLERQKQDALDQTHSKLIVPWDCQIEDDNYQIELWILKKGKEYLTIEKDKKIKIFPPSEG